MKQAYYLVEANDVPSLVGAGQGAGDVSPLPPAPSGPSPVRPMTLVAVAVFLFLNMAVLWYWSGFPLNNTKFVYGAPAAGAANYAFQSTRYTWEWWSIWLLSLNLLLPNSLVAAVVNNAEPLFAIVHMLFAKLSVWSNIACIVMLSFQWAVECNQAGSPCNDPRWCNSYFSSQPNFCPNTVPFTPAVTGSLVRSDEFFQHWLFSIFFLLFSIFGHIWANKLLQKAGLFKSIASY